MADGCVERDAPAAAALGRAGHDRSLVVLKRVDRLARSQFGVASVNQMLDEGATRRWIRWKVSAGILVVAEPGVLRLADSPVSFESRAMSACLARGPDAVLSFGSAGKIWELDMGPRPEQRLEVTVAFGSTVRTTAAVIVHRSRDLPRQDRTLVGRLPVTTVNRTILDLARHLTEGQIERLIDDSLLRGKTTVPLLLSALRRSMRQGRAGLLSVRAAVQPWLAGPLDSHLEAEVLRLLLSSGIPPPARQLEVMHGGNLVARVDFAWPSHKVVLEVDGYRYHDGPTRFAHDRHRANELASLGWTVLATTQKEVRTDPTALLDALRLRLTPAPP